MAELTKAQLNRIRDLLKAHQMLQMMILAFHNGTLGVLFGDPEMGAIKSTLHKKARMIQDELETLGVTADL